MNKNCFLNVMCFFLDMFLMLDSTNPFIKIMFLILGAVSVFLAYSQYEDNV